MRINVDVDGVEKTLEKLFAYRTETVDRIKEVTRNTAFKIERKAKQRVAVDTGHLRRSIHSNSLSGGFAFEVGTNVFYGVYVEYGTGIYAAKGNGRKTPWAYIDPKTKKLVWTRGSRPQPFLIPSFDEVKPDFVSDLKKAVKGV
jgi:HK97 gp10 family phage protein